MGNFLGGNICPEVFDYRLLLSFVETGLDGRIIKASVTKRLLSAVSEKILSHCIQFSRFHSLGHALLTANAFPKVFRFFSSPSECNKVRERQQMTW